MQESALSSKIQRKNEAAECRRVALRGSPGFQTVTTAGAERVLLGAAHDHSNPIRTELPAVPLAVHDLERFP